MYPKFIFTYTNPANDILEGYVYEEDNYEESKYKVATAFNNKKYLGAYNIELVNEQTGFYKKYSFPENTTNTNISLANIQKGLYVVRLIINEQVVHISNLLIQ